ncbi:hypothetical protein ACTI_85530 [Actinoplanes sp. OR16]|uniref:hypothetical protein n=1 Tax=Actinoplanes sp. OR16 TaxID=946334 RepID=UPI000F6CB65F|nr:hypothetical protein [Actinoplanes sp. OR16]BBH71868.1 hypothetical protein ACTI_85530 [Actinoplanes sp. OR16]
MSYLDVPRLHFAGRFFADPSTINNAGGNYALPAAAIDSRLASPTLSPGSPLLWNPRGKHWFYLDACAVGACRDSTGTIRTTAAGAAGDPVVGGTVESTNSPTYAKLVDLDPEMQFASAVFGLEIKLTLPGGHGGFVGRLAPVPMRDLWFGRAGGGMPGAAGVYQSVLTGITWDTSVRSPVLDQLRAASQAILSVKFVAYAYSPDGGPDVNAPPPPALAATFCRGKVVGTIGPGQLSEPQHFPADRLLTDGANGPAGTKNNTWKGAYGPAPFKVDVARKKLVIDLGNTMPEVAPGGNRRDEAGSKLTAVIKTGPATTTTIGDLDFTRIHYEQTAGIEELSLTTAQLASLRTKPLTLVHRKVLAPTVLIEHAAGRYLDVSHIAFRLNPGESQLVRFHVRTFGEPKPAAQVIGLKILGGAPPGGLTVPPNLASVAGATVTTAAGVAAVTFTAGDPATPRPALDGQLYKVGFYWGAAAAGDLRGVIFIRVFDQYKIVASPVYADVSPILEPYSKLYPFMKAWVDLGARNAIVAYRAGHPGDADRAKLMLDLGEDDPRYMPVTRDLSSSKRKVLLDWLNRGAPA